MNYEFAVDPESLDHDQAWRFFLDQFGFTAGRYISEFPRRWPQAKPTGRCRRVKADGCNWPSG